MQPIVSTTTAFLLLAGLSCVAGGNSTIGTEVFKISNAGTWIKGTVTEFDDPTNMYTVTWSPNTLEFALNATTTETYAITNKRLYFEFLSAQIREEEESNIP